MVVVVVIVVVDAAAVVVVVVILYLEALGSQLIRVRCLATFGCGNLGTDGVRILPSDVTISGPIGSEIR